MPWRTSRCWCTEGATAGQVRDLVSYADSYSPLADELEALAHFLRYSVTAARNAAGLEALTTYSLAQRLSKLPQNAHLKPHVADMRRALGRGRKVSPEVAAQKAADRAAKAAAKVAKKAAKLLPPAPIPTTEQCDRYSRQCVTRTSPPMQKRAGTLTSWRNTSGMNSRSLRMVSDRARDAPGLPAATAAGDQRLTAAACE